MTLPWDPPIRPESVTLASISALGHHNNLCEEHECATPSAGQNMHAIVPLKPRFSPDLTMGPLRTRALPIMSTCKLRRPLEEPLDIKEELGHISLF